MHSNTFFQRVCVRDLLCRDVTDKERGGSEPLSSVMHFPFDSAAATESYFPALLPLKRFVLRSAEECAAERS